MRSIAPVLPALLAAGLGCSAAFAPRHQSAPLAYVRGDGDGICASVDASVRPNGYDEIMACARADSQAGAQLYSKLHIGEGDPRLDATVWKVTVTRADTGVVLEAALAPQKRPWAGCVYGRCWMNSLSVNALREPWRAGRYDIRYTNGVDQTSFDLSITLE